MKKLLLLGFGVLMTGVISAQVIFSGISPAAIQGDYDMTYGQTNSQWGSVDLNDPANVVEDTLVAFLDDTLACVSATNQADIAGHIAILYRGTCEFGLKASLAQAAGAIACVIINNEPGAPIGMAGGANGGAVTIPVVMISDVDGAKLINEMKNGPVTVFIGNKLGYFDNDIGLRANRVLRPMYSSVPSQIATNGTEYSVKIGASIKSNGVNDAKNVTLQAIVTHNGSEVYNETSTPLDIISGDTFFFTLPDLAPASWDEGYYKLTYIASSDSTDQSNFDNTMESDFIISASGDLSYASIDETTLLPNSSGGSHPIDGSTQNPISPFSSCIHFRDANASKLAPQSITFNAFKGTTAAIPSMEGEEIKLSVYEYNDVFTDLNDPAVSNPISSYVDVMTKDYFYPSDLGDEMITVDFDYQTVVALEDDQRYLFCVTTYIDDIYLGTDSKRDYTLNLDEYLQPLFPVEAGSGNFNPMGFGPNFVPSISVKFMDASKVSLNAEKKAINMNAYPSPASDLLNVDFKQNEVSKVELVNMMGQTVASQNVANNVTKATLNVADVDNGVYIVKVYLTNNMTHTMQVVVNH
ncbi:MAG TPA: PA domain-containing protein [Brumimicrobium sp.]|nr:PA domain-containing protein [Brumimicrobium sp.]